MNPLTPNELTLTYEVMKGGFRIPNANEIKANKKAGADKKKKKLLDTFAVDQSTSGVVATSGSAEFSLKTMLSQKRARIDEKDNIALRLPRPASSYFDANFFQGVTGSHLLGLVQAANYEITRNFQVYFSISLNLLLLICGISIFLF